MDFLNQKAENDITSCLKRYRIVSNKDVRKCTDDSNLLVVVRLK